MIAAAIESLGDEVLELRLKRLASIERQALILLLAHLGEFDRRRLYADRGHSSLFVYCTKELGYSEQGAYKRIQAARAARSHPILLERLAQADITLATIVVLAPHLRPWNVLALLDDARGKSIREVERIAAGVSPRPDAPDVVRALSNQAASAQSQEETSASQPDGAPEMAPTTETPTPALPQPTPGEVVPGTRPTAPPGSPQPCDRLEPLSATRFLFRFTAGDSLRSKFERTALLLRVPLGNGAMETVFERGLDAILAKLDPVRRRSSRREGPEQRRSPGRAVPRAVRDAVWLRDAGRCVFIGPGGNRCEATQWLEIDHIVPFARGGRSDDPSNLRLLCRSHNQLEARRAFGEGAVKRRKRT